MNHTLTMDVHRVGAYGCSMVIINMYTEHQQYGVAFVGPNITFQRPFRNFDEALRKYKELLGIISVVEEAYDEPAH